MTSVGGWSCSTCTYFHHAPSQRCAMCGELRVTKAQMRDFVLGKPIPNDGVSSNASERTAGDAEAKVQRPSASLQQSRLTTPTTASSKAAPTQGLKPAPFKNPYAKGPVSSQQVQNHPKSAVNKAYSSPSRQNPLQRQAPQQVHHAASMQNQGTAAQQHRTNHTAKQQNVHNLPAATMQTSVRQQQQPPPPASTKRGTAASNPSNKKARNPFILAKPVPRPVYKPGPVPLATQFAGEWIYPTAENFPKRQYQLEISESAIFHNTLVSLPTGLGKTLIAAVVLYNYYRWFPTGKVIFMAPTLPLVNQQVKACYDIVGIPAQDTAVLTGKTQAARREVVWRERRVFFCTPQTVQKDLDGGRCEAVNVVCVVLDEAHKATGDYSYVKVVEQLEAAGARFRILGLSATPGTNIKSIQQVVDALRINKIEARHDTDSNVAKYIHERQSEIVIVKQASACKNIERLLNDLIGPLLDRLRRGGALTRITGNATVTSYSIIKAREEFVKRTNDESMSGYFFAAQQLIQLRSSLHQHGANVVRGKLSRWRNEPQRGIMASIVKGKEFQLLWEVITKSTCDPDSSQTTVQDKLMNNPKLTKLQEILLEHFERARACSTSSRAIVFSQFRDSVSEIVSVLAASQPLIRPRHFVGQGKGAKGDGKAAQLKGMKQAEQYQVIREFREDVYNVLVCTCIGEEGLDIGEVDLIVNFDTLRSPIRMIQRTGRTGRKRNGRVVCLVAEGPEEKTLNASKQSERNLVHALKNPNSFKVTPAAPMFPEKPVLCERNMLVEKSFHMSQVEGHDGARTKRRTAQAFNQRTAVNQVCWRLSEEEERQRSESLRAFGNLKISAAASLSLILRRRLLTARSMATSSSKGRNSGRLSGILHHVEGDDYNREVAATKPNALRSRAFRCDESELDLLFPLNVTVTKKTQASAVGDEVMVSGNIRRTAENTAASTTDSTSFQTPDPEQGLAMREEVYETQSFAVARSGSSNAHDERSCLLQLKWSTTNSTSAAQEESPSFHDAPELDRDGRQAASNSQHGDQHAGDTEQHTAASRARPILTGAPQTESDKTVEGQNDLAMAQTEEFLLPPPDSSSSSEEEYEDDDCGEKDEQTALVGSLNEGATGTADVKSGKAVAQEASRSEALEPKEDEDNESTRKLFEDSFRLPTQESSSEDESLEDEENDTAVLWKKANENIVVNLHHPDVEKVCYNEVPENAVKARSSLSDQTDGQSKRSHGPAGPMDEEAVLPLLESADDCQFLAIAPARINRRTRAIEDSPASTHQERKKLPAGLDTQRDSELVDTQQDELTNTQSESSSAYNERNETADDIVCAVCFSKDSPDDNPIILCDGLRCKVAVHMLCYSVPLAVLDSDEEWRCDFCEYLHAGGNGGVKCCVCHQEMGGPLQRIQGKDWIHVGCKRERNSLRTSKPRLKKIRQKTERHEDGIAELAGSKNPRHPLSDVSANEARAARPTKKRRRHLRFIDEEAEIDSDEDVDGDDCDEAEILRIERDEATAGSFINDSSQLGYTQDELGQLEAGAAVDLIHRAVDSERERSREFATPLLNRRLRERSQRDSWSPFSGRESDSGLGKMHFIRSVLEHHRQGGRAEEIEELYNELEEEAGEVDNVRDDLIPQRPKRQILEYTGSDSEEDL